jgi:chitosanase
MLTSTQKQTAQGIVNIFETGEVRGVYGDVTLIPGDTGHLTFGRSQTTLGSGNLFLLLQRYSDQPGAKYSQALLPYLSRLKAQDLALDDDELLQNTLRATADDVVMRDTQDAFFDAVYWAPAAEAADGQGIVTALGVTVVYDSFVHGSWKAMRDRTNAAAGMVGAAGEQQWIRAYVATRRNWLATSPRSDLRATVYRMDALQRLIDQGYWNLDLPLVVRDKEISTLSLSATPVGCYDGPQAGSRALSVGSPLERGLDVRLLQLALCRSGASIKADGVFGRTSSGCVRDYQVANNLPATGVADIALIARLVQP